MASIAGFQNEGRLHESELDKLVAIAERDGSIDTDEARVLNNIISKLKPEELGDSMRDRVDALREKLAPLL